LQKGWTKLKTSFVLLFIVIAVCGVCILGQFLQCAKLQLSRENWISLYQVHPFCKIARPKPSICKVGTTIWVAL